MRDKASRSDKISVRSYPYDNEKETLGLRVLLGPPGSNIINVSICLCNL